MVAGTYTVEAPDVPLDVKGGLLAHVTPSGEPGFRMLPGVQFESSIACGLPGEIPDWCADPRGTKTFDSVGWGEGVTFTAYKGLRCGPFGNEDLEAKAVRSLDWGIGFAAEQALVNAIAADEDTTVASGGAVSPVVGLGVAEAAAALLPGGHLLITRADIPQFGGAIRNPGNTGALFTRQSTPVINYVINQAPEIGGTTPSAGQFWIIAVGQPYLWLGSTLTTQANRLEYNDWDVVAERMGALAWECGATAVLVEA